MFNLAVPQIVFDEVTRQGLAEWKTVLFSDQAGQIRTTEGYQLGEVQGPEAAEEADVVVVPSWFDDGRTPSESLLRMLQDAHQRRVTILGLCLGAIPVAGAGLLSGRGQSRTGSAWIRTRRLDAARRLLETTDLIVDQIAADCGSGSAVTLRQNFATALSTTPTEYRRHFDTRLMPPASR